MTGVRGLALAAVLALAGCVLPGTGGPEGPGPAMEAEAIEVTPLPAPEAQAAVAEALTEAAAPADAPSSAETAAPDAAGASEGEAATEAPVAEEPPPEVVKSPSQIACEKRGGQFVPAGSKKVFACVTATRDGGKRCTKEGDCEGLCLARSGTCSPITPVFGCQEILNQNGMRITECVE